jgi:hypothetical protein
MIVPILVGQAILPAAAFQAPLSERRLKACGAVESLRQLIENTLGVATGRFPIGRRLPTCPTMLRPLARNSRRLDK